MDWDDGKVDNAEICYSTVNERWELRLIGARPTHKVFATITNEKVKNLEEMIGYSKHYIKLKDWVEVDSSGSHTQKDTWVAKL